MKSPLKAIALAALFGGSILAAGPCFANGSAGNDHAAEQSPHMQAMMALKEKIPQEYRIMERTPIHPDEDSIARGRTLYREQCASCHGENGRGEGPAASALETPPADFLDMEHSAVYGPGEKYWIIGNGTDETGMPAFGRIGPKERWHLVNFLLHLQEEKGQGSAHEHGH